ATIAVVTASEQPTSVRLWNEFYDGAWARTNRGIVQVVNVSKDAEPGLVRTLGVNRFPSMLVYVRGPQGVRQLGTYDNCATAEAAVELVRSLDIGVSSPAKSDQAVTQSAFGDTYASQQTSCPAPVYSPPAAPPVPQASPQPLTFAPGAGVPQVQA